MSQQWPGQQPHHQGPPPPQGWTPPSQPGPPQPGPGPYAPGQFAQGQPSQPPLPPPGFIALTLQGSELTSNLNTPQVRVDGFHMPVRYGMNMLPVPPGRRRIEVESHWMRTFGQASMEVDVLEGQQVPVFYAAPVHQFARGRIGHEKQKRTGWLLLSCLIVVPLALIALVVILMAMGGN